MPLYDWQEPACAQTVDILSKSDICLNTSDTGVGKTFVALEALKRLKAPALVWCPKTVIGSWRKVAEFMGAEEYILDVQNPERIALEKTQWFNGYRWHLPAGAILIVDEVHRGCSGPESNQTKVLALTKAWGIKVMAMSATIADSPLKMRAIGFLTGLHDFTRPGYYGWCLRNGCFRSAHHNGLEFSKGKTGRDTMLKLHERLRPFMVRQKVQDIAGFPTTSIQPLLLTLPDKDTAEFRAAYDAMEEALKKPGANELVEILRARQRTEFLKVPGLIDLIEDNMEEGKSVVVLVQFRNTLERLEQKFPWMAQIHGDQTSQKRQDEIDRFQRNEARLLAGIMSAGGVGTSLHDLDGTHPRVAFHTPGWKAEDMRQAFGRVHRAGGTHSVQHIVLADKTIEERVYRSVMRKSGRIDALQDGDLR